MCRAITLLACCLCYAQVDAGEAAPIRPEDRVRLFNGKDLNGLYTWLKGSGHKDPKGVFSVKNGLLRISGEGYGYVGTRNAYRDYRLIVEYKWGKKPQGRKIVRNSGILLHAVAPDGAAGGTWAASIECQLAQGCVGDLIPIRGKDQRGKLIPVAFTADVAIGPDRRPRWKPGGKPRRFTRGQLWWSKHQPFFKELIDTRGKNDVESPLGRWTRVECICRGKTITVVVNGVRVNRCYDAYPSAGKILLQSEGCELYVRDSNCHR